MRNTIWTYTSPVVCHYVREDRYVLILEKRNLFYDKITAWAHKPFKKSNYGDNIWGSLWEWSMLKGDGLSHAFARFEISVSEAKQLSPRIGAKLDLRWPPTQSSDEL